MLYEVITLSATVILRDRGACDGDLDAQMVREPVNEPVGIRIGREQVLGDPQPVAPAGDKDAIFLEPRGEVRRDALRQEGAEIVRPAMTCRRAGEADPGKPAGQRLRNNFV